jgi:uncharacterized protein
MVDTSQDNGSLPTEPASEPTVRPVSADTLASLTAVAEEVGGAYKPRPGTEGAVAYTHFDTPSSEDNAITILLTKEHMNQLPSQTLVRIKSLNDDEQSLPGRSPSPTAFARTPP